MINPFSNKPVDIPEKDGENFYKNYEPQNVNRPLPTVPAVEDSPESLLEPEIFAGFVDEFENSGPQG